MTTRMTPRARGLVVHLSEGDRLMASPSLESAVPAWPLADATVHADGTARLTINGAERPLTATDPETARAELVRLVRDELAADLGRPVPLRTTDPDGTEGLLAVAPDGAVTELAPSRTRHERPLGPAPAPPDRGRPPAPLRVAAAAPDAYPASLDAADLE